MDATIQAKVNQWLQGDYDQQTKNEILQLQKDNPNELVESFYSNLEFGTGGLRGIMGVGRNRIINTQLGWLRRVMRITSGNHTRDRLSKLPLPTIAGTTAGFLLKQQQRFLQQMG